MLSRVADRLYWMARYLERAEDTARLLAAYNHLIMDIPRGSDLGWDVLIRILDADTAFFRSYRVGNEQNVLKFLIAEQDNVSSIPFAVRCARENVRTTRDVLPEETWEQINELYLYTEEMAEKSVGRRNRRAFLEEVVNRCQLINGMLATTLPRDHAYRFLRLGHLLERSDMTTRLIDVGVAEILSRDGVDSAIEPLLWGSLLQALSAFGSYRRMIGPLIEADLVVEFMFREAILPRSVAYCLSEIRGELKPLNNHGPALRVLDRSRRKLARLDAGAMSREQLHQYIDDFQALLSELHRQITATWFNPHTP
ncbi:alpha-E domain-containing protein [Kineobactrum sediminis]|uniref:Alpha-E domain-containing protein n=1 Tax=Kineobactrum sediminis TaxID=1905677 RepID=A0A2N5Y085_9GAMM|nr:alpha-E domain-containing protein [Kineobactrum sediminis]PLW81811.1 alpha-E domain-containing protein [Kineobactrum sediminis]